MLWSAQVTTTQEGQEEGKFLSYETKAPRIPLLLLFLCLKMKRFVSRNSSSKLWELECRINDSGPSETFLEGHFLGGSCRPSLCRENVSPERAWAFGKWPSES